MKRIILLFIVLTYFSVYPQNLAGKKICLDPGHGFIPGQAANCSDAETKRFESWMNHFVVPELKKYLLREGATVITTRADYDSIGPCITLTQRKTIANNANADWFHSVHHNAYTGTSNYSLLLYKQLNNTVCPNGNLTWPGVTDSMGMFMVNKLYGALYTTAAYYRGDYCFLGYNLGVLSTLSMPGTLSEGSFFDYPAEIPRLRCVAYLRTEAEALYHAFLQYYKKPLPAHGSLVGVISNSVNNAPVNKARIVIKSENKTVFTDSLNNGFYRFDTLNPGTYSLTVYAGIDSTVSQINVTGSTINKKNISFAVYSAPEDVRIKSVEFSGNDLRVSWSKNIAPVEFYDVYYTNAMSSWPTAPNVSIAGTDSSVLISGVTGSKTYYVKMKARNQLGSSPDFSKTYAAGTYTGTEKYLIVDGFNRFGGSGSNTVKAHTFAAAYGNAIAKTNGSFASSSNTAITDANSFTGYTGIIWFLGDESTVDETFTTSEQLLLKNYLMQGGKLFTSGSEIAWDLDNKGTTTDKDFIYNYLKVRYTADNPSPNTPAAAGIPGSFFNEITQFTFGQVYPEDYPDVIDTINGSKPILQYNATQKAGTVFSGVFPSGTAPGRVVFMGFGLETISDTSVTGKIFRLVDGYFRGTVSVDHHESLRPVSLQAFAYPNPFNNSTMLKVNIPAEATYSITMYSALGAEVRTIRNERMNVGSFTIPIDCSALSSGIYFLHIRSEKHNTSIKLNLVK